ncbi:dimethylarginine dimethylaminohydrolase family protein [Streptomyces sp. NPDC059224]|uniref:dimethylarginine dimethylaminohydrolase family protein n=1 Tax=Streptomyces sp. NPDC059224 TaxID=3346775 RepID=UPI0036B69C39
MSSPHTDGAAAELPSTLGGSGWAPRAATHRGEVAAGRVWARCGYRSEVAPLREVLLVRPPDSLAQVDDAAAQLMTERLDLGLLRAQAEAVADAYRRLGVRVHVVSPPPSAPPNVIFLRDLFLVTEEGAIVGRTASAQRAGEERHAAAALAELGIPVLRTLAGGATFEGADALWAAPDTVLLGCGFRTNEGGARAVTEVLDSQGVRTVRVPLGPGVQHLLGSVVFVDERLAVLHKAAATAELRAELARLDYAVVELEPDEEVVRSRAMNLVATAPGRVLMPAGCPKTRTTLEAAGLDVHVVEVGEYVKAAGALGCLTGVLRRDAPA